MICALSFLAYISAIEILQRLAYIYDFNHRPWYYTGRPYHPQSRIILFHCALFCLSLASLCVIACF